MGVSGSGKTTVGKLLARELGWSFADADDFHSAANKAKMAAGHPLNDADRAPWLTALRQHIEECLASGKNVVIACSALKASYRAQLRGNSDAIKWVHLHGSPELIRSRLASRSGHYMRAQMLDSQLATLEPPKHALTVDVAATPAEIVDQIRRALHL
ncbi:carbohydrate kinase, thermoresistant glucokinase family [Opitutus terrae PB90-1]|uniref:Gluconokinase n=2 Tax=Opitutus terrae TaxID=107709 RepID=B1ZVM1_OPITP|nr:carbohydrate kinase, thermoresistant glucokinase family [Opitutus terrae PB90-1]